MKKLTRQRWSKLARRRRRWSPAPAAAQAARAVHPRHLQGLPAPVLAGREAGRREGRQGLQRRRSPSKARRPSPRSTSRSRCSRPRWTRSPTAICFAALDSKAAIPLLEKAKAAKIPVIGFDSGVDSDIPVTTAATDNIAAAALRRRQDGRADRRRRRGRRHRPRPDQPHRHRPPRRLPQPDEGSIPNIKIVDIQYGGGDQLKSTDIAKAIIQAHPNLKGFFGANEGSIIGVLNGGQGTEEGRQDRRHRLRLRQAADGRHPQRR